MTEIVFIPLLDEGIDVRRPARAYRRPDGAYIILRPPDYDPETETWQFPPGSTVICENLKTADGRTILAAVRPAQDEEQDDRRAQTA